MKVLLFIEVIILTEKKSPVISFKNFTFQYRAQKRPTLMGINLDIYPGERVLIAGPSGCGKALLPAASTD